MNYSEVNVSTSLTANSYGVHEKLQMGIYIINLLFGLPAHSYVIRLILAGTKTGIASEFFILNYSVCEIGVCLKTLIFALSVWFPIVGVFDFFLTGFSMTGRPLFQCLICVERYLAVVHPVTFLKFKPLRYRLMSSAVAWIFCFGSCVFYMFAIRSYQVVLVCFMTLQLLVFLFVQLFCCVAVLRVLKQSGPGERGREREEENNTKRRAFQLILITTVTTVIIYGPMTITGILDILLYIYVDIMMVWISAFICYLLAGFVQPILYLQRNGKIFCFWFLKKSAN